MRTVLAVVFSKLIAGDTTGHILKSNWFFIWFETYFTIIKKVCVS